AMNNKGLALSCLGKHREAYDCFCHALITLPQSPDLWYNKGYELLQLAEFSDAVAAFHTALSLCSPTDIELKRRIVAEIEKII
ncbi:MAG TPA: tetratricopeptide repeat protein, partial [Methanocorpusculum sp.]|nr:tetratricopeptide repeat protein [Methanocorpusculum sp.]